MKLVIVESPAKAKTINKYLGRDYKVLASYGHVRDLPSKNGSVLPEQDFAMTWTTDSRGKEKLQAIAREARNADSIILATDPDREGEAISWHILEELSKKKLLKDRAVERVVFNAITKRSILEAMRNPRQIDGPLVEAYLARRAIDYLVGFSLSPVLWRKLPGARSAGRVQSVALRLVCDREEEIERFVPKEYWTILADLEADRAPFEARLTGFNGEKLGRQDVGSEEQATTIKRMLEVADMRVAAVEAKPVTRNPYAPFTTSTLQQDASSKLGFSAARTMQVAQRLYEGIDLGGETVGLITYMRTDGVQMAGEAIEETRRVIGERFGKMFVPDKARFYSSKAKNAQEAHEAVRPTSLNRHPEEMRRHLETDQARLYELIWKRAVASQMASAKLERTTVDIDATAKNGAGDDRATLRAVGSVVKFEGFLSVYGDTRKKDDEDDRRLPPMREGQVLENKDVRATQHFTEPPARYSEASLIRKLEELGIGRPSTYASTLQTLQDRDYVEIDKRRLTPTDKGRVLIPFLENFFSRYVQYEFTADLEQQLDQISAGDLDWKEVLRAFWRDLEQALKATDDIGVRDVIDKLNEVLATYAFPPREDGSDPRTCPKCGKGDLSIKLSKDGSFIGCSNYPDCKFTYKLGEKPGDGNASDGVLGQDPDTGEDIVLKSGRFGPYVERGEGNKATSSLPGGWRPEDVDLQKALRLLSLPRTVGVHPETSEEIYARFGRYGPLLQMGDASKKQYRNLEDEEDVFNVGLNRAVALFAEPPRRGRGRAAPKPPLKDLGEHPEFGGPMVVKDGRFGPYVAWNKINATLPKSAVPSELTAEQAVDLLREKAEKSGKSLKPTAKKSARKPAAKKAAKKPARKAPAKSRAKAEA